MSWILDMSESLFGSGHQSRREVESVGQTICFRSKLVVQQRDMLQSNYPRKHRQVPTLGEDVLACL